MNEATLMRSQVYTDIQGLSQLKYGAAHNSPEAKKEVAQQFESMLVQMVMNSMREANKAFSSGLFGSEAMDMYEDLFDKQLSILISQSGLGFSDQILKNLEQQETRGIPSTSTPTLPTQIPQATPQPVIVETKEMNTVKPKPETFHSQEDFLQKLWSSAKFAAQSLGVGPEWLLAQAALETNWGKSILPQGKSDSSNNLFNIKADENWKNATTTVEALEQKDGVITKEKSKFRSYETFAESFSDYVDLIKQHGRYNNLLTDAKDPESFFNGLQKAGYATDKEYGAKIMKIFSSHSFQNSIKKLKSMP